MEKYSKPVMVLEAIEDEVYTATAALPNNVNQVIVVSGETTTVTVTVPDTSPVPAEVPSVIN